MEDRMGTINSLEAEQMKQITLLPGVNNQHSCGGALISKSHQEGIASMSALAAKQKSDCDRWHRRKTL
jgi:hypothetical protein